jgi:hypothetical protein
MSKKEQPFTRKVIPLERVEWVEAVNDCAPLFNQFWKFPDLPEATKLSNLERERLLNALKSEVEEKKQAGERKTKTNLEKLQKESDLQLCQRRVREIATHVKCGTFCPAEGIQEPDKPWVFALNRTPLRTRVRHCNEKNYLLVLGNDFVRPLQDRLDAGSESAQKRAEEERARRTTKLLGAWTDVRLIKDAERLREFVKSTKVNIERDTPFRTYGFSTSRMRESALKQAEETERIRLEKERNIDLKNQRAYIEQEIKDEQQRLQKHIQTHKAKIIDDYCRSSYARVAGQWEDTINECQKIAKKNIPERMLCKGPTIPRSRQLTTEERLIRKAVGRALTREEAESGRVNKRVLSDEEKKLKKIIEPQALTPEEIKKNVVYLPTEEEKKKNNLLNLYNYLGSMQRAYQQGDYGVFDVCPGEKKGDNCVDTNDQIIPKIKIFSPFGSVTAMNEQEGYLRTINCATPFSGYKIPYKFAAGIPFHAAQLANPRMVYQLEPIRLKK